MNVRQRYQDIVQVRRVRDFSRERDYDAFSIVRVFNACLNELGGRNSWVTIRTPDTALYRRAQGAGGTTGLPRDAIELDYDSRMELGVTGRPDGEGFYATKLAITQSTFVDRVKAHWSHPRLDYRIPYRLAILSAVLGGIGFALGIVGVILGILGLRS